MILHAWLNRKWNPHPLASRRWVQALRVCRYIHQQTIKLNDLNVTHEFGIREPEVPFYRWLVTKSKWVENLLIASNNIVFLGILYWQVPQYVYVNITHLMFKHKNYSELSYYWGHTNFLEPNNVDHINSQPMLNSNTRRLVWTTLVVS